MRKIVCDLCDSTEFVKEGGMFICQGCGTKYSLEEAKSMMREVEGGAAPVSSAPVNAVPMGNPNQQQIDNILVLATTAYEAQNYAEAENYCNQAVVLDAMCYKAWNLKGKAVGWQSKIDNLRIEEAAHSFCKAIDFAPEDEKEGLKTEAVEELKKLGLALVSLRKDRFSGSPDTAELNGFTSDKKTILSALLVLLSHGNAVDMPEGYLDQVATMMNEAGVAALNMARKAWRDVDHPSQKDLTTYLDWNCNICEVFRQAINTSDDDGEADITRYENLIIALEDPIGKSSQKQQWNSFLEKYVWVDGYSLTDSAVSSRRSEVTKCKTKISELKKAVADKKAAEAKKAEEEKQARIKAYWEAHAAEDDHTLLAYDRPGSWSLKYNIIWDKFFDSGLFGADVFEREVKYYIQKCECYGTPLDNRKTYTKSDWILWCSAMTDDQEVRRKLIRPVADFLRETKSRVPFSDWYDAKTGEYCHFKGRTVQGGIFMPMLLVQ